MVDTLQRLHDTLYIKGTDGLEILNKTNEFYDSAWDKLIIVGTVALGIIGILVPFAIQWYQKRTLKLNEEILKKDILEYLEQVKKEIISEVDKKTNNQLKTQEADYKKLIDSTNGKIYHTLMIGHINAGDYSQALNSAITALNRYNKIKDDQNVHRILGAISRIIPKLTYIQYKQVIDNHKRNLPTLLEEISLEEKFASSYELLQKIVDEITKLDNTDTK